MRDDFAKFFDDNKLKTGQQTICWRKRSGQVSFASGILHHNSVSQSVDHLPLYRMAFAIYSVFSKKVS